MRRLVVVAGLGALVLGGCAGRPPSAADIQGRWVNSDGAGIEFRSDGTFVAHRIPGRIFADKLVPKMEVGELYEGEGTWTVEMGVNDVQVELGFSRFGPLERFGTSLEWSGTGEDLALFFWEDDPDSGRKYEFRRVR